MNSKVQSLTETDLKQQIIAHGNIPRHVAIIMDGNGRWAKCRELKRVAGHKEGINSVREVVRIAGEIGVEYLTLYTFSTENWKRPKGEVSALMTLLLKTIRTEIEELKKNNVRLDTIGCLEDLPYLARKSMQHAKNALKDNTGLNLILALSYSSRQEIMDAVKKIVQEANRGGITSEEITEEYITSKLYTSNIPDPDLLIRTSGELRISNFLLWQLAYTEIYVTDVFWPDFRQFEFLQAIKGYQSRERRFGKVSEQLIVGQPSVK